MSTADKSSAWRRGTHVLVPEANAVGMIAVIRSLGRAGYVVHACSGLPTALGLRSSFVSYGAVSPDYGTPHFLEWLDDYLARHSISVIVPSEGFLLAIQSAFERYSRLIPVASNPEVVLRALSKVDVAQAFLRAPVELGLAKNLPPTIIVRTGRVPDVESIRKLGAPFYIKADALHSRRGGEAHIERVEDATVLSDRIDAALETHSSALVQGFVGGRKAAHSFCFHRGEIIAESGVLGIHTNPHHGGMMSLRRTWHHEEMRADALRRLRYLEWDGAVMMEYKWEPASDRFHLIEVNARYWGYLHLDLFAGVDYPRIQVDRFLGRSESNPSPRSNVTCRHTVPGEVGYVVSKIKDNNVGILAKIAAVIGFFARFLNPAEHSDLLFPGDRKLYWLQWWQYIVGIVNSRLTGSNRSPSAS